MQKVIQFQVRKGEKYYFATSPDLPIVTQAATLDELTHNIEEAVTLHFEDEEENDFAPNPSLLMNFEIPAHA